MLVRILHFSEAPFAPTAFEVRRGIDITFQKLHVKGQDPSRSCADLSKSGYRMSCNTEGLLPTLTTGSKLFHLGRREIISPFVGLASYLGHAQNAHLFVSLFKIRHPELDLEPSILVGFSKLALLGACPQSSLFYIQVQLTHIG